MENPGNLAKNPVKIPGKIVYFAVGHSNLGNIRENDFHDLADTLFSDIKILFSFKYQNCFVFGLRNVLCLVSEMMSFLYLLRPIGLMFVFSVHCVCLQFNINLNLFSAGLSNRNPKDPETFHLVAEGSLP